MFNPYTLAVHGTVTASICLIIATGAQADSFTPIPALALPNQPALLTLNNAPVDPPRGPLFINIWATWCKPCIDELPALNALKARYPDAGVQWVALNYGDSLSQVRQFMATTAIELPVLLDVTTLFTQQLPVKGLPATFLVNRDGQVRYQLDGYADWTNPALVRQWESLIPELLSPQ
ncbi:TlpA family protein disulfide reductase [Saccharospirillum sp.]|uniref:TlpA family protein disulfide reductase n=1 Tax=Saccharospirillum sp. TaxID=2033801 RepID=UPI0034A0862E